MSSVLGKTFAVIGGSGRVGALISRRLTEEGATARVVSRDPWRSSGRLPPGTDVRSADVRDPGSLDAPLRGCAGVVFSVEPGMAESGRDSPEATMYDGVRNALAAAVRHGGRPHFVLISQIFVTRREHPMNAYGRLLDWRLRGEDAVRDSGLPYTVVRPSWLTDDGCTGERIRLGQGDRGDGWISRAAVAEACVRVLGEPGAVGRTFEIYNEPGPALADWSTSFARLAPDRVPTGSGLPLH